MTYNDGYYDVDDISGLFEINSWKKRKNSLIYVFENQLLSQEIFI